MESKICAYCGSENSASADKCIVCGGKFSAVLSAENRQPDNKNCKRKKPNVFVVIVSIILCVVLFLSLIVSSVLIVTQKTLSKENITATVNGTDFYDLADSLLHGDTVEEFCEDFLSESMFRNIEFSEKDVRKIINSGILKDFFSEKIYDYVCDIKYENNAGYLSNKDVEKIFFKLYDKNQKYIGHSLNDKEETFIKNYIESLDFTELDLSELRDDNRGLFLCGKAILTPLSVVFLLVFALLMILIVIAVNKHYCHLWMGELGITFLASGGIMGLGWIISIIMLKNGNSFMRIINSMLEYPYSVIKTVALVLLVVGIVLLVLSMILKKITKKQ